MLPVLATLCLVCNRVDIFQVLAAEHSVFFLDTSGPGAFERQAGETLSNPAEADLIVQLVDALQLGGVPLNTIGVMSPYRLQVCAHVAMFPP